MGIMKLTKGHSPETVELASRTAIEKNVISYKYFSIILKQAMPCEIGVSAEKVIAHGNVRGQAAYAGGGINA
jgi:hypothetical protein